MHGGTPSTEQWDTWHGHTNKQVRDELVRQHFEADPEKPLPPVQVDKGSGNLRAVPVGEVSMFVSYVCASVGEVRIGMRCVLVCDSEGLTGCVGCTTRFECGLSDPYLTCPPAFHPRQVLAEVASVLGTDMTRWKAMIEESVRRREQRALGSGRGGAGRYGPRPALPSPVVGGVPPAAGAVGGMDGAGMVDLGPPSHRRNKPYKDIDVPKVSGTYVGLLNRASWVGLGVCVCV